MFSQLEVNDHFLLLFSPSILTGVAGKQMQKKVS
jgi:hypothetical protein